MPPLLLLLLLLLLPLLLLSFVFELLRLRRNFILGCETGMVLISISISTSFFSFLPSFLSRCLSFQVDDDADADDDDDDNDYDYDYDYDYDV
jgi:hypothetical protein